MMTLTMLRPWAIVYQSGVALNSPSVNAAPLISSPAASKDSAVLMLSRGLNLFTPQQRCSQLLPRSSRNPRSAGVSAKPLRTVGSYWPFAATLFDYIRRAMPFDAPQSLTADEVYAVSAYLLNRNGIVPADAVLDAATLAQIKMPNRDGFIDRDGRRSPRQVPR